MQNAGTGAQSNTYGVTDYGNGGATATSQNRTTFSFNMFLNNVTAGLKTVNNADSDIIQNVFSFVTNSTATGIINIHSEPTYGTNTIGLNAATAPLIGMQISDSQFGTRKTATRTSSRTTTSWAAAPVWPAASASTLSKPLISPTPPSS